MIDLIQNGSIWLKMDRFGSIWFNLVKNGSIWFKMDLFGSKWIYLVQMDAFGSKWIHLDQNGSERCWTFLSHISEGIITKE